MSAAEIRMNHRHFGGGCTGCDWFASDVTKSIRFEHAEHVLSLIEALEPPARSAHPPAP